MLKGHTPGPWVTERDSYPPNRPQIATVAWVSDWCVGIPTPGYPGGNYRDAEYGSSEADARLIAAAPDLLEVLRFCSEYLGCIPESAAGGDDDAVRLYKLATAVIRKATEE